MPIETDYLEYHKSVARELRATKNRVRNLIGSRHWQTDGEHKEAVLRKVLRAHLPQSVVVGKGFVCFEHGASSQIDVMVVTRNKPTLFRDSELFIVTPDAVEAIIEVKTSQRRPDELCETLHKLGDNIERIRQQGNADCRAGLFVYDDQENYGDDRVLLEMSKGAGRQDNRALNWVALGRKRFFRYWSTPWNSAPCWHSYELDEGLAYAYFVSNVIWDTGRESNSSVQFAWFPIEGGKEQYRKWRMLLNGEEPTRF